MYKIKLNAVDDVKRFVRIATNMESDVFLHLGRQVVDGTSLLGIFALDLTKVLDLEIVEKVDGECEKFVAELREMGVLVE